MEKTKHYFIVNPKAGKINKVEELSKDVERIFKNNLKIDIDYNIYETRSKNDATRFVKEICEKEICNEEVSKLKFYACGGDGTLNEVVNGLIGYKNASFSVIPYGSGNDFIRNFGDNKDFYNVENHIKSSIHKVDLLNINGLYSVNLCNIGFDAKVADNMVKFKKIPFINGTMAYTLAIFYSLFNKLYNNLNLIIDDNYSIEGEFLLCVIANGKCYGGGYKGTPLAMVDDGLIDLCLVKKMSRFRLLNVLKLYKKGEHLNSEKLKDYVIYKKCKRVSIHSQDEFVICVDGEVKKSKLLEIEIKNKAINFSIPFIDRV